MAKTPKRKAAPKTARPTGRPSLGERQQVAARYPAVVLEGIKRRAIEQGITLNDAYIRAGLDYGSFPGGRPVIKFEKRSIASKVTTAEREPTAPGSRLDKKSIGARTGPKIVKGAAAAPAAVEEEAV